MSGSLGKPLQEVSHLLTGTWQPLIRFGLNIPGLGGGNHIPPMYLSPRHTLERSQEIPFPPPLQYLPLLGPSRSVSLQEDPQGSDGSCYLGLIALCSWRGATGAATMA